MEPLFRTGRVKKTIGSMRIACWIPRAINTQYGRVILIAFPLQLWLHERSSMVPFTCCPILLKRKSYVHQFNDPLHITAGTETLEYYVSNCNGGAGNGVSYL